MNALLRLVLSGSAVGAIALMAASGCSSDSDDGTPAPEGGDNGGGTAGSSSKGGSTGKGGSASGGAPEGGAGGGTEAPGGASPGGSDAGGSGGAGAGADSGGAGTTGGAAAGSDAGGSGTGGAGSVAVGKFCNTLVFGQDPDFVSTTFRLEIGEGADMVSFTADSFECVPVTGTACSPIPVGTDIPVALFDADNDAQPLDSALVDIADGEEIYFWNDLDNGNNPIIAAATDETLVCKDTDYDTLFPPN